MADTVFAKIIRGEIPCHKVYEDSRVFAFLDINPLSPGHMLVVPKEAAERLDELSDESAAAIGRVLPRPCRAVVAATGTREYNVLENNGHPGPPGDRTGALSHYPQAERARGSRHRLAADQPESPSRRPYSPKRLQTRSSERYGARRVNFA